MNPPVRTARGQPLLVLCVILGSWVLARTAVIEFGGPAIGVQLAQQAIGTSFAPQAAPRALPNQKPGEEAIPGQPPVPAANLPEPTRLIVPPKAFGPVAPLPGAQLSPASGAVAEPVPVQTAPVPIPPAPQPSFGGIGPVSPKVAGRHQLLWMAALSQLPSPGAIPVASLPRPVAKNPTPSVARWSADGWLLWRRDGAGLTGGGFAPSTYGASQAGAVIRYRLAPASAHRPAIYLRATSALEAPRGEEAALGLSARPIAGLPVIAVAELRATRFQAGTRLRPAAALISEFPPLDLPLKARAEAYVQAGYVGGTGATAFVDGQVKVDRPLLKLGKGELRLGGGAWGGAQEGASRLDAGPSATLGMPIGKANARLAMDWRFRVAGNAAPRSGPALTLSAGF